MGHIQDIRREMDEWNHGLRTVIEGIEMADRSQRGQLPTRYARCAVNLLQESAQSWLSQAEQFTQDIIVTESEIQGHGALYGHDVRANSSRCRTDESPTRRPEPAPDEEHDEE